PDLGTTVLLLCVVLSMAFVAGIRMTYLLGVLAMGAVTAAYFVLGTEYRRKRLFAFLNPWEDPHGSGFQTIQSFVSLHSGNLFGVGLGNGNSKLFYLPEVHSDFIFALIGEELGFLGAFATIAAFTFLMYLLLKGTLAASGAFGRLFGFGLAVALAFQ